MYIHINYNVLYLTFPSFVFTFFYSFGVLDAFFRKVTVLVLIYSIVDPVSMLQIATITKNNKKQITRRYDFTYCSKKKYVIQIT